MSAKNKIDATVILNTRLQNQQVSVHNVKSLGRLTEWMGILQAQDYAAAKWQLALRVPGTTDSGIEQAIADKSIVRSWAFRGTLHFMSPQNIYMFIDLVGERMIKSMAGRHVQLGLSDVDLIKGAKLFEKMTAGGKELTRDEIRAAMQAKKIPSEGLQLNHIMLCAAFKGLLCLGNRRGNQFTYTLLPEWVAKPKPVKRTEALACIAKIYFQSHGPATIADFAWWVGITLADAKIGFEEVRNDLQSVDVDGQTHWFLKDSELITAKSGVFLLPSFDEFLLGYKDRNYALPAEHASHVIGTGNGLFAAVVVINGKAEGTWKRTIKKNTVEVSATPFTKFSEANKKAIVKEAKRYGEYFGLKETVSF